MRLRLLTALAVLVSVASACGGTIEPNDGPLTTSPPSGTPPSNSGSPPAGDSGAGGPDAGAPPDGGVKSDAGKPPDAGNTVVDAGPPVVLPFPDGGTRATPMGLLSRGLPAFSSSGQANLGVDNNYDTAWRSSGTPSDAAPQWIAVSLASVPTAKKQRLLVHWTNDDNYNWDGVMMHDPAYNLARDYTVEINGAAGGSAAPTTGWTPVATVTGNGFHGRMHFVDPGSTVVNWVRVRVTGSAGSSGNTDVSLNLDVYDASGGLGDSWIFFGDSITAGSMGHHSPCYGACGTNLSFGQLVNQTRPAFTPAQENGGIGGLTSADGRANIERWLSLSPARFVALAYGANDAGGGCTGTCADNYIANIRFMIDKILEQGRVPVIGKISWARDSQRQAGCQILNARIEQLFALYPKLMRGPDLYTFFQANQSLISGDNLHPSPAGYYALRQQWAAAVTATTGPYAP